MSRLIEGLESRVLFTAYVVNTTADTIAADGLLSLREAVLAANTNTAIGDAAAGSATGDVIRFKGSLAKSTITLTNGVLEVNDDLQVRGAFLGITIDANHNGWAFHVSSAEAFVLNGLSVTNGNGFLGGALWLEGGGTTSMTRMTFHDNTGSSNGTSIFSNNQTVTILSSTFFDNITTSGGGAIFCESGTVTVRGSIIRDNHANSAGGGIYNRGIVNLFNTRIIDNSAGGGGGIHNDGGTVNVRGGSISRNTSQAGGGAIRTEAGTLDVRNATLDENIALVGGAISSTDATTTVRGSFLRKNAARAGGAITAGNAIPTGSLTVINSVLTGNSAGLLDLSVLGDGGALNLGGETFPITISGSLIRGNTATGNGGGLINRSDTVVNLRNTIIAGNGAGVAGGGIFADSGSITDLTTTLIANNKPDNQAGTGTIN